MEGGEKSHMSIDLADENDYVFPSVATIKRLKDAYYADENNLVAAKEYALELYDYHIQEDFSEKKMLEETKCELEHLHTRFPDDREIAEAFTYCLSAWAEEKDKATLEAVKKELFLMLQRFPKSEDIAESYIRSLVELSRKEMSAITCYTYWCEGGKVRKSFRDNLDIEEDYHTLEEIVDKRHKYLLCSQAEQVLKNINQTNACLRNAIEYAKSLINLLEIEDDKTKCQEYVATIESLVKQYPDCFDLIEMQVEALYYTSSSPEEMQQAADYICEILKRYPDNEEIAEYYILLLECLCEDEYYSDGLVRIIRDYHHLFPQNITITASYARAIGGNGESKSTDEIEKILEFIWDIYIQTNNDNEILGAYSTLFENYLERMPEDKNYAIEFYPFYSKWLEEPIQKVAPNTDEVITEYETIIEACQIEEITPLDILHALNNDMKSDNSYRWRME